MSGIWARNDKVLFTRIMFNSSTYNAWNKHIQQSRSCSPYQRCTLDLGFLFVIVVERRQGYYAGLLQDCKYPESRRKSCFFKSHYHYHHHHSITSSTFTTSAKATITLLVV